MWIVVAVLDVARFYPCTYLIGRVLLKLNMDFGLLLVVALVTLWRHAATR
jgi:hypothetical protein